jgi:hypothetical protein
MIDAQSPGNAIGTTRWCAGARSKLSQRIFVDGQSVTLAVRTGKLLLMSRL